jgi:hypothetical protein
MRNVGLSIIFFLSGFSAKFAAQPSTTSRLEVLDSTALVQSRGGMLLDYSNGLPWNPKHFKLTTADGYIYYLTEGVGLDKVQDPFGNTLTYSKNGILQCRAQRRLPTRRPRPPHRRLAWFAYVRWQTDCFERNEDHSDADAQ